MRSYPTDSPQAAARVLALTLMADGEVGDLETDWLQGQAVAAQLGLSPQELQAVLDGFCADLRANEPWVWGDACPVDERTLAALMGEIQDPALRRRLLRLCVGLAEVDSEVTEGESIVLRAAVEHWGLQSAMLRPVPAA